MSACENCVIFHVEDEQTATQLLLVLGAVVCCAAALALWAWAGKSSGRRAWGLVITGSGFVMVPLAAVPLVQTIVVTGSDAAPIHASHINCDKPIYSSWNYQTANTDRLRAAADICRHADRQPLITAAGLLALAVAVVIAGVVIARTGRRRETASAS